jgi:uncharacterized membrane protein YsdA (DUF1294 family)
MALKNLCACNAVRRVVESTVLQTARVGGVLSRQCTIGVAVQSHKRVRNTFVLAARSIV